MVGSCGLVIDHKDYVLAATPDGKVIDLNAENIYGILKVKCSEEYRDVDPKDVCLLRRNIVSCMTVTLVKFVSMKSILIMTKYRCSWH